jgi:D-amino peptidase
MKVFISADIEGINHICSWNETEYGDPRYFEFRQQMTEEVKRACLGAKRAGASEILVKDAHDSALNIDFNQLPEYVKLHRGWEGSPASMMAGLDKSFDAVIFIGYHSASRSDGNPLSHTMNTHLHHVKINGEIASEFLINALYASYLGVPIAFLSGDLNLTNQVKTMNSNIEVVATKEGHHNAIVSLHPKVTNQMIEEQVFISLTKDLSKNLITLPKEFNIEVAFKDRKDAYSTSFFPGCTLKGTDKVLYHCNNYYEALIMFKFVL